MAFIIGAFLICHASHLNARECQNVADFYQIKSIMGQNTCDEEIDPANLEAEIIQDGCQVEMDIQLTIHGKKLSGKGKWTYSIMGYSCKGTETFSGKKL